MSPVDLITYICIAVFGLTAIITLLALTNVIPIGRTPQEHDRYLKNFVRALVIEIIVICVGAFGTRITQELRRGDKTTPQKSTNDGAVPAPQWEYQTLTASGNADSEHERDVRVAVQIPAGWQYVEYKTSENTRAGKSTFDAGITRNDTGAVTEVWMTLHAESRDFGAGGNWMGRTLSVTVKRPSQGSGSPSPRS